MLAAACKRFSDAARFLAANAVKVHVVAKPGITTHAELAAQAATRT